MRRAALLACGLVVAGSTWSAPYDVVFADAVGSSDARAAELYDRGVEAHERSNFAEAARFFAEADALAPNDVTLETALRECVRADAALLAMTLHDRAKRVRAPSAGLREALIAVANSFAERVGYVRLACTDCRAALGGAALSSEREHLVEPGTHEISFDGAPPRVVLVDVKPGEHVAVSPEAIAKPTPPPPADAAGIHPAWLTIGVVATAGFGAATIGSYAQADAFANELATLRAAHVVKGAADVSAAGQNAETRMYAFGALTGVSALVTAALAIWAVDWDGANAVSVSASPGFVGVSGRF